MCSQYLTCSKRFLTTMFCFVSPYVSDLLLNCGVVLSKLSVYLKLFSAMICISDLCPLWGFHRRLMIYPYNYIKCDRSSSKSSNCACVFNWNNENGPFHGRKSWSSSKKTYALTSAWWFILNLICLIQNKKHSSSVRNVNFWVKRHPPMFLENRHLGLSPWCCAGLFNAAGHRPEHKALWMKFCHILAAIPSGSGLGLGLGIDRW